MATPTPSVITQWVKQHGWLCAGWRRPPHNACSQSTTSNPGAHHRRHGVIATLSGCRPTVMSEGCLVLVFTSIVDTELLWVGSRTRVALVTKAVLPSGVTATAFGFAPTGMSVGCFIRVFTSIVDTEPLPLL